MAGNFSHHGQLSEVVNSSDAMGPWARAAFGCGCDAIPIPLNAWAEMEIGDAIKCNPQKTSNIRFDIIIVSLMILYHTYICHQFLWILWRQSKLPMG